MVGARGEDGVTTETIQRNIQSEKNQEGEQCIARRGQLSNNDRWAFCQESRGIKNKALQVVRPSPDRKNQTGTFLYNGESLGSETIKAGSKT